MINFKEYIIGIDVGGSKIIAALIKGGKVFYKIKVPIPKNRKNFCGKLKAITEQLIKKAGGPKNIRGIGCGIAGALDLKRGTVLKSPNLKFLDSFDVKNWLEKKFKTAVKIDNDARCFLRGEYLFGAGRGYKNIVGITFGTGVGGGIIINGKMVYGANDSTGELGHMVINEGKDWEALTVKQARKLKFSEISVEEFKKNLGIGFSNIVNVLDPEVIIVGGGAAETVGKFLPKIKTITNKLIISSKSRKNVKILVGKLGEDAGAIGAAALFIK
jgi:glucokinase